MQLANLLLAPEDEVADEIPRIVRRHERPLFRTDTGLDARFAIQDRLSFLRLLQCLALLWRAVDEPVGGRLLEVITASRPVLVDDCRAEEDLGEQKVVRLRGRILNDEPEATDLSDTNQLVEEDQEFFPVLYPLHDSLELLLRREAPLVQMLEGVLHHLHRLEVYAREEGQNNIALRHSIEYATPPHERFFNLGEKVNHMVSLAEIVLDVVVFRRDAEFQELILERAGLLEQTEGPSYFHSN